MVKTSPRLNAALELLDYANRIMDIGTDHGYFPIMAITSGKAKTAIATDNKAMPLLTATANVAKANLSDKIMLSLQDGLTKLPLDVDCVSIMGMGGKRICSLLDLGNLDRVRQLILGPNIDHFELRDWLENHDFVITGERFVRDCGHDYQLFSAIHGKMHLSHSEKQYGPFIIKEKSELFVGHIEHQIMLLNQAMSLAKNPQKRLDLAKQITTLKELVL